MKRRVEPLARSRQVAASTSWRASTATSYLESARGRRNLDVLTHALVTRIVVENGVATGIRLANGSEVKADYVISAADMKTTLYTMLGGRHVDPQHEEIGQVANEGHVGVGKVLVVDRNEVDGTPSNPG